MTALPATVFPVSAVAVFDDDVWEDLLNYIEERQPDGVRLLRVAAARKPKPVGPAMEV